MSKGKSKKKPTKNRERKDEVKDFFEKDRTFNRVDMHLYYYRKLKMTEKSFNVMKVLPIALIIIQIIAFIIFMMRSDDASPDEKMIFFGGFVIIVTITMPIIQHLYKRNDTSSNAKIEYYLLFQNQMLLKHLNLSAEEKNDAEEVLWRIANLESIHTVSEEEFLNIRYHKEFSGLVKKEK